MLKANSWKLLFCFQYISNMYLPPCSGFSSGGSKILVQEGLVGGRVLESKRNSFELFFLYLIA